MIEELSGFLKEWQQTYTLLVLMLFLNTKFKSLANSIKYHRHDEEGIPVDSNGKELFPDGKI